MVIINHIMTFPAFDKNQENEIEVLHILTQPSRRAVRLTF